MANIFEEILKRGEQGKVLTTQELLAGVNPQNPSQAAPSANPLLQQEQIPLVLAPEERQKIATQLIEKPKAASKVASAISGPKKTNVNMMQEPKLTTVKVDEAGNAINGGGGDATSASLQAASDSGLAGGGAAGGALQGAAIGTSIAPGWGTAIGAAAGGIAGALGAKAKKKQRKAEAEAQAQRNIANIAQETGRGRNVGIGNIMNALQSALLRQR